MRRQSEHFADYARLLDAADRRTDLVYPAFMSRGEIRAHIADMRSRRRSAGRAIPDGAPLYPGAGQDASARASASGASPRATPFAWRLDIGSGARSRVGRPLTWTEFDAAGCVRDAARSRRSRELWGDVVLARRDVADELPSVGCRRRRAAGRHPCRARAATCSRRPASTGCCRNCSDLPAPLYHHHRLIIGPDGRKLSKSQRDTGLAGAARQPAARRTTSGAWSVSTRNDDSQMRAMPALRTARMLTMANAPPSPIGDRQLQIAAG